jgi:hypothetical protein
MAHLRSWLRLAPGLRLWLVKTAGLIVVIRLGLWLLPFRTVLSLLEKLSQPTNSPQLPRSVALNRVAWAVTETSRYVPRATCLTQALAARVLLVRKGYPAEVRFGLARDETGRLEAHAWVESDDDIVIGGADSRQRFTPFSSVERAAR